MTAIELTDEVKTAISWTITLVNAFVMFTSGLVIDIKEVWLFFKVHFRWAVLTGLMCQFGMMPLLSYVFATNLTNSQSLAVIIQGTCPGSAILNLFSAWCAGNHKLAQTLTSVGTLAAIALMPFFLFIYSQGILKEEDCLAEYGDGCPPIPYLAIMRTLAILCCSLVLGIAVKYRFKRYKVIKKISKVGTILGFLVIMTFIVMAVLVYEEAWLVQPEMWICAVFIPLLGYIIGFGFAIVSKNMVAILVSKYHVRFVAPEALIEFDWSECRTIGLACGLQNTQLAMSTVFGAYSLDSKVIKDMHPYSPLYGVIELAYAFVIAAVYALVERYYYRVRHAPGPRFPNLNIEEREHYLNQFIKRDDEAQDAAFDAAQVRDLIHRLPDGFVRRFVKNQSYDELDDDQTYQTLQTMTETLRTLPSLSAEERGAFQELVNWNTLIQQKSEPRVRQRTVSTSGRQTADSAQDAADCNAAQKQRLPSHITDFSVKPADRFSVSQVVEAEMHVDLSASERSDSAADSTHTTSDVMYTERTAPTSTKSSTKRGKFMITKNVKLDDPISKDDSKSSRSSQSSMGSVASDFGVFQTKRASRDGNVGRDSLQSAPSQSKPKLQHQQSLPILGQKGRFSIRTQSESPTQRGRFAIKTKKEGMTELKSYKILKLCKFKH